MLNILFYVFLCSCLLLVIMTATQRDRQGNGVSLFGYNIYVILSGSMAPTFDTGSLIFVRQTPVEEIAAGDILTYAVGERNTIITHRVTEVLHSNGQYSFITQGDANNVIDTTPVNESQIRGKTVFWIEGVGAFLLWLRNPSSMLLMAIILLTVIVAPGLIRAQRKNTAGQP